MKYKIPDKVFGRKVDGAIERVLAQKPQVPEPRQVAPVANLKNPENFVQIPNINILISMEQAYNNMTYEDTHKALLKEGFFMPAPADFGPYLICAINAYNGEAKLYDGKGQELAKSKISELYEKLTKNCWIWLNAKFVAGSGHKSLDLETVTGLDNHGQLQAKKEPLDTCLNEDRSADLSFNKQGLAVRKSKNQSPERGKNRYYYYPREDAVAGFYANSRWSILDCNWNPQLSNSALGVFACVNERAAKKN